MATVTVLKFPSADGAERTLGVIENLSKQQLIDLQDAALVTWPVDKKKPKTKHLDSLAGAGAWGGAFWGFLFGLIFFVPILGLAVGAAVGGLIGSMTHVGIDKEFIDRTKNSVTVGTSALFLQTSAAVQDKVAEAFRGIDFEIISTNLSQEQEDKMREAFAEEEEAPVRR